MRNARQSVRRGSLCYLWPLPKGSSLARQIQCHLPRRGFISHSRWFFLVCDILSHSISYIRILKFRVATAFVPYAWAGKVLYLLAMDVSPSLAADLSVLHPSWDTGWASRWLLTHQVWLLWLKTLLKWKQQLGGERRRKGREKKIHMHTHVHNS